MLKKVKTIATKVKIAELCTEIQSLQRQRVWYLKTRIMFANRLRAGVADSMGYHSGMEEAGRKKMFEEAEKRMKAILAEGKVTDNISSMVLSTYPAINAAEEIQNDYHSMMTKLARKLPVAAWVQEEDQRGVGLPLLATVIGETGDLFNYANPAKVWKRLGCAPYTHGGETLMGSTWRMRQGAKKGETKLQAKDWEEMGYNPRRRSVAYLVGEMLMKFNKSIYRARYDEAKVRVHSSHPEWQWKPCEVCENDADRKTTCRKCNGTGHKCQRAHLHGMLLASKMLQKNLWIEWHK